MGKLSGEEKDGAKGQEAPDGSSGFLSDPTGRSPVGQTGIGTTDMVKRRDWNNHPPHSLPVNALP